MKIGDESFTKTMLMNALSQNKKLQTQMETANTQFRNLFAAVINQLMTQTEIPSTIQPTQSNSYPSTVDMGNMLLNSLAPDFTTENMYSDPNVTDPLTGNMYTSANILDPTIANIYQNNNVPTINNFPTINNGSMPLNKNVPLSFQPTNPNTINQVLDGKLAGMGDIFVQAGQQFNINPNLLAAIAQHETGNGNSRAAIDKNNIAGMMGPNGLKSYSSVEESIMDMAQNLSKNYLGSGLTSISQIGAKYAPIGAGNDPTGLNNYWVKGVSRYFNQLNV